MAGEAWLEQLLDWCVAAGLVCSLNQHHDDWIGTALIADEPTFQSALARFSAIWTQAAARFGDANLDALVFE